MSVVTALLLLPPGVGVVWVSPLPLWRGVVAIVRLLLPLLLLPLLLLLLVTALVATVSA